MKAINRSTQTLIVLGGGIFLLRGLYVAEQCYRMGSWVIELKGTAYTGGMAMFIVGSMIVLGGGFVITGLRALSK